MNDQALPSPDPDAATALVAGLRAAMGLTLVEMGERVGLSKSQMHEVERTDRASLRVALAIETLSASVPGMAIDAACLCEDVRLSRHGMNTATESARDHG